MANYFIIGGDGKQYGPVTDADVNQWITEGRLNALSQAKGEGDAEFRPLAQFPEFAATLAPQTAAPATITLPLFKAGGNSGRDTVLQQVKGPAVGLMVTAILNMVLALWGLVKLLFFRAGIEQNYAGIPQLNDPQVQHWLHLLNGPIGILENIFGLAVSIVILVGAIKMQSLRSYSLAFTAALLAVIPCLTPCCFLGLPLGIWALVVLNKSEVKAQFE
jgi:hypothetical protein